VVWLPLPLALQARLICSAPLKEASERSWDLSPLLDSARVACESERKLCAAKENFGTGGTGPLEAPRGAPARAAAAPACCGGAAAAAAFAASCAQRVSVLVTGGLGLKLLSGSA
jgi:hypothetical protein